MFTPRYTHYIPMVIPMIHIGSTWVTEVSKIAMERPCCPSWWRSAGRVDADWRSAWVWGTLRCHQTWRPGKYTIYTFFFNGKTIGKL